tara:strand:+ start:184 stop:600 length:417 start_codon:yes stop_codon:yes gene_type:complete
MIIDKLCMPAILYIGFTLIHIVIDIFQKLYNTALLKFILMIIFTTMLDLLCKSGLTLLSWIIVFLPFILLTAITAMLLLSLGLSPEKGFLRYKIKTSNDEITNNTESDNTESENSDTQNVDLDEELTTNVEIENMFSK